MPGLIDDFLPAFDAEVSEEILVAADEVETFAAIERADLAQDRVVRTLGGLGDLPHLLARGRLGFEAQASSPAAPLPLGIVLAPWTLAERAGAELVYGVAVSLDGLEPRLEHAPPEAFATLGAGLARVVLSFEVERAPAGGTEVRSTLRATRADTPGWMWSIAQATARMLLRRVLALVRAEAERGRISPA